MSSAHRRQITSETCTLAGMLSSFFGSLLAIVSNTPRAHGAAQFTSLNGTSAGGPTHVGCEQSKLLTRKPPAGGAEGFRRTYEAARKYKRKQFASEGKFTEPFQGEARRRGMVIQ